MGRLFRLLCIISFLAEPCFASFISFIEDDGKRRLRPGDVTYALPSGYTGKALPGTHQAHRWMIVHADRFGPKPIGNLSLMPPDDNGVSNICFAFNHRPYFESNDSCLEALTIALIQEAAHLAEEAGMGPILSLRANDFSFESIKILFERMSRMGWQVRTVSQVLGDKRFQILEYSLNIEPALLLDLLARHIQWKLKAKL